VKGEEGELLMPVDSGVRGWMPKKKTVQSSITSMGFPLLQKTGEMCADRQIDVPGKFWNFNRGRTSEEETGSDSNAIYMCSARVSVSRNNLLRHVVDQSVEKFKHTQKGSTEDIVEENISDRGSKTDRTVPDDEIGLNPQDWETNAELEVFLSYLTGGTSFRS
jgi:hypothetical protein